MEEGQPRQRRSCAQDRRSGAVRSKGKRRREASGGEGTHGGDGGGTAGRTALSPCDKRSLDAPSCELATTATARGLRNPPTDDCRAALVLKSFSHLSLGGLRREHRGLALARHGAQVRDVVVGQVLELPRGPQDGGADVHE
eukprot:658212-Pyramimonas_sp.AAC.1